MVPGAEFPGILPKSKQSEAYSAGLLPAGPKTNPASHHPEYSALHRLCPLGVWRWGVEVFRAPSSGGAQAGGDGDGGGQVATAVQSAALPFSALHRLCPLAVGGVPVVAVLFVLFAL